MSITIDLAKAAFLWIGNAAEGDCDLEPEEDCCNADEDIGSKAGSPRIAATPRCFSPGDDDDAEHSEADEENGDAEPGPPPGFLDRRGAWRGPAAEVIHG